MAIKPHIYHVVGYCEAHHAAKAEDVIESCKIVRGVIRNEFLGSVDMTKDKTVNNRKEELILDAKAILNAIVLLNPTASDPLSDPETLEKAVKIGILDAPHLKGNPAACGKLVTRLVNGALYAYDVNKGRIIPEKERLEKIMEKNYHKDIT